MSGLWGVLVAKIFVIRFFPQKLFGKLIGKIDWKICWKIVWKICWKICWKIGWKICWKNVLENLLEKYVRNLAGNVGWKCWLNIWLEKMLVNGCEIIGGKIVATNLPLRLSTIYKPWTTYEKMIASWWLLLRPKDAFREIPSSFLMARLVVNDFWTLCWPSLAYCPGDPAKNWRIHPEGDGLFRMVNFLDA